MSGDVHVRFCESERASFSTCTHLACARDATGGESNARQESAVGTETELSSRHRVSRTKDRRVKQLRYDESVPVSVEKIYVASQILGKTRLNQ